MFLDEIAKHFSLNGATKNTYTLSLVNDNLVLIQGKIKINIYTDTTITYSLNKKTFSIIGESLKIKNLTKDTLLILGNISTIQKS